MAYDEGLAERIQDYLKDDDRVTSKKMFGGIAFLINRHMCCGIVKDILMVRVGPDAYEDALSQPYAKEMDFTGRSLRGMVYVDPDGFADDADLAAWIERGRDFAGSLPPKD